MTPTQLADIDARVVKAVQNPLFRRIQRLAPDCLLTTTPVPLPEGETTRTASGLFTTKTRTDSRKSWGEVVRVLKAGDNDMGIIPGNLVLISEFNGDIIVDRDGNEHNETPLMVVAIGDVMAVLGE